MEEANFYHALKIDNDRCIGCTHCMKECPTGAIRIRDGKALIHKDWCVDCGECLKSCPTEAIYVEQDDSYTTTALRTELKTLITGA